MGPSPRRCSGISFKGVQQGTNKFFYTRDHLGSIRDVVCNSDYYSAVRRHG